MNASRTNESEQGAAAGDRHVIRADGLSATISADGAELVSLRDGAGEELLWQAGPQWPRHAPVLFPTVGRLAGDTLRHNGKAYPLPQHGFARDSRFAWGERGEDAARLILADDEGTRRLYPFPFLIEMIYAVTKRTLSVTTRVTNPGDEVLPCGIGAHPGFRWPLVAGVAKEAHAIEFGAAETGPRLAIEDGLLGAAEPLPFDGRVLPLSDDVFTAGALVIPDVRSRSVRFRARNAAGEPLRSLLLSWEGYKDLGLWSKPEGAPFLCIEPWFGMASRVGWDGPFVEKPGILLLPPGETREFVWRVTVEG